MSSPIQLIVGLANPGAQYTATRHNAGAWFLKELAQEAAVSLKVESKFRGLYAVARLESLCHLLIPTTYMNLSGQSVKACASYLKIPPASMLVAHDDIDLPAGVVRLKWDGGDGGHNGLKDIISHLHTKQFYRLRIGVGRPTGHQDVADFVLHPPTKIELEKINLALQQAYAALPLILNGEIQKAMQQLHTES